MKPDQQTDPPCMAGSSRWPRSVILARDSVRACGGDVDDAAMDIMAGAANGEYAHDEAVKILIERRQGGAE